MVLLPDSPAPVEEKIERNTSISQKAKTIEKHIFLVHAFERNSSGSIGEPTYNLH